MADNLWSTSYIYAPGVANPSSPYIPSSGVSSPSPAPRAAAAAPRSLTSAAPSIPQHWRRVTTVCRVESLEDPTMPGQGVSDDDLLDWVCQVLSGELREQGPHVGTPALTLLRKAILSLPVKERAEFFEGLRRLKKPGQHLQAEAAASSGKPAKASAGRKRAQPVKRRK